MATDGSGLFRWINQRAAAWVVSGIGLVLAGLSLWYLIVVKALALPASTPLGTLALALRGIEIALLGGFSIVLVYAGYWLATSQFDSERIWWTGLWTIIGLSGIVAIVALVQSFKIVQGATISEPTLIQEMLLAAGGGGIAGLLIGISTIRETVNAEQVARQRDTLMFVNELLRHNVLNGMNIVLAYADQIEEEVESDDPDLEAVCDDLDTIQLRGQTVVELIENVRALMKSVSGELSRREVDLTPVLTDEVERARSEHDDVELELDGTVDVSVYADDLLSAVFENLLSNAIEHNDAETPRVEIAVENGEESAVVSIADNGPGIADEMKEAYFGPGEQDDGSVGQGIGLYLVDTLVERYDGEVWVEDNEPQGAVFKVELPLA